MSFRLSFLFFLATSSSKTAFLFLDSFSPLANQVRLGDFPDWVNFFSFAVSKSETYLGG